MLKAQTLIAIALVAASSVGRASEPPLPLGQEAYVWQRSWTPPIQQAVAEHGLAFSNLVVLAAEVSWKQNQPQVVRVPIDHAALLQASCPVGLALRIGTFAGPFSTNDKRVTFLADLARSVVNDARSNNLALTELQLDFDCAASKLDGYRRWVETIRRHVAPVPVTITALPSWLNQPAFTNLIQATDGYGLQVHSLERPAGIHSKFSLCDPGAARRAVAKAGELGIPFRVALPTYGYLLAFDRDGQFIGLSAESPGKNWPPDAQLREVRSDPLEVAELVQHWTTNRPPALRGVIWYRLPVAVDNFNWRWPTLSAILDSRLPRESLRAQARRVEAGLVEINLVNDGEIDISSRVAVEVRWQNSRLVAGDGLSGFELVDAGASAAKFQTTSQLFRLPAGESRVIGWLRFEPDCEVRCELKR